MAYWLTEPRNNPTAAMPQVDSDVSSAANRKLCRGEPLPPDEWPKLIRVITGHTVLPDFFSIHAGIWGVNERTREVLLNTAPSDFEFYPLRAENVRGWSLKGSYFVMNVISHRDSVVWESSTVKRYARQPEFGDGWIIPLDVDYAETAVKLDRERVRGAEAWHENMLGSTASWLIFVSDRLRDTIIAKGLKPIRMNKVTEV